MTEDSKFGPMVDPLNEKFGPGVFGVWDTGGGCTAVQAFLEGDLTVMITDSFQSMNGEEAFITDMLTRRDNGGDASYGYCIGVYADEGSTMLAQDDFVTATAEELPTLVMKLIIEAMGNRR